MEPPEDHCVKDIYSECFEREVPSERFSKLELGPMPFDRSCFYSKKEADDGHEDAKTENILDLGISTIF